MVQQKEAKILVDGFIMGTKSNLDRYLDLEGWTIDARRYTEAMFKFNMIDDILIAIAEVNKSPTIQSSALTLLEESQIGRQSL